MDATFTVLAEPLRRKVLDALRTRDHSAGELERLLGVSQPMASKHLRALRDAGLVRVTRQAQRRIYALDPAPLAELDAWLDGYREFWTGALDRLARHLGEED